MKPYEIHNTLMFDRFMEGNVETTLTQDELNYFNETVERIKYSVNVNVPILPLNYDIFKGKQRNALGSCWSENSDEKKPICITIDEFFIQECFAAIEHPYMKLEPETLEQVIAHEIAHIHVWRHGKKHTALTNHICGLIENGEPHGLNNA